MDVFLKALLIPLAILAASLASRRFGHAVAGVLVGFPVVAAPVMLVLILQHDSARIGAIAHATLASVPASIAFLVSFGWLARRRRWWVCLGGALCVFLVVGVGLIALAPLAQPSRAAQLALQVGLPLAAPWIGLLLLPARSSAVAVAPASLPGIPPSELLVRMAVGFLLGVALIVGAGRVDPAISGLMMTWPVTGMVLPAFTVALYGSAAVLALLGGFAKGMIAFALFFLALAGSIDAGLPASAAFGVAILMPLLVATVLKQVGRGHRAPV